MENSHPSMKQALIRTHRLSGKGRFAVSLLCAILTAHSVNAIDFQPSQAVRNFLTEPPRYESLLLRRVLYSAPVAFRNRRDARRFAEGLRDDGRVPPAVTSLFELRFQSQPPAFLLRALARPEDFEQPEADRLEPLAGRFTTNWWIVRAVHPGQVQFLNSPNGLDIGAGGETNTYYWEHERWATEFLRLGMFDVLQDSIRWNERGDGFDAISESGHSCRATVFAGTGVETAALRLDYSGDHPSRVIQIAFSQQDERWLPRRVSIHHLTDPADAVSSTPYASLEAVEWTLATLPLPREWFSPEPYLKTNDLWVESLHGDFYLLEDSATGVVRTLVKPQGSRWQLLRMSRYLYAIALLAGAVVVAWHFLSGWRSKLELRRPRKPTNTSNL